MTPSSSWVPASFDSVQCATPAGSGGGAPAAPRHASSRGGDGATRSRRGSWRLAVVASQRGVRRAPSSGASVESHETTLDLSGWRETTPAQMAHLVKVSSALSHDRYTIVKTQRSREHVHRRHSSPITPESCARTVSSSGARPMPHRVLRTNSRSNSIYQICRSSVRRQSIHDPVLECVQTPDQWWTGCASPIKPRWPSFRLSFRR